MASATAERVLETVRAAGREGVLPGDLVETLGVPKGSVTRAINGLVERELVRREGDRVRPVLRRGRRLIQTAERDELGLRLIRESGQAGLSVLDLAQRLDVTRGIAYQTVYRLRRQEQIRRIGVTRTARWIDAA